MRVGRDELLLVRPRVNDVRSKEDGTSGSSSLPRWPFMALTGFLVCAGSKLPG
jgi:hypothetical protein